jgi:hypothetical protein
MSHHNLSKADPMTMKKVVISLSGDADLGNLSSVGRKIGLLLIHRCNLAL